MNYLIIKRNNIISAFTKSRRVINQTVCKYPSILTTDCINSNATPFKSYKSYIKYMKDSKSRVNNKSPVNIPKWAIEYSEFVNLFDNKIRYQLFSNLKMEYANIIGSKNINITGKIARVDILLTTTFNNLINSSKLSDTNFEVESIFYKYQRNSSLILADTHCSDKIIIPDHVKKLFTTADIKQHKLFKQLSGLSFNNKYAYLKNIKYDNLIKLFQSTLTIRFIDKNGGFLQYISIPSMLSENNIRSKVKLNAIIKAHKANKNVFKLSDEIFIYDVDEYNINEEKILQFLMANDNSKIYNIFKKAKSIPKLGNSDYMKMLKNMKFKATLFDHQDIGVSWLYDLYKNNLPGAILGDDMGLGKALHENTLIKIPNGWKEIKKLRKHDSVIGKDGNIINVTGVFPQGSRTSYKITFIDNRSIIADKEHLWNIYVDDFVGPITVNTELIIQLMDKNSRIGIPLCEPEQTNNVNEYSNIALYTIGVSLTKSESNKCNLNDEKIIEGFEQISPAGKIELLKGIFNKSNVIYIRNDLAKKIQIIIWSIGGIANLDDNRLEFINHNILYGIKKSNLIIKSIEKVARDRTVCISVDSIDKLYVAENYIVTHNTVQAIGFLTLSKIKNALIVAPASVVGVWHKEIQKFYPKLANKVTVDSYESIRSKKFSKQLDVVILDEGQKVKNPATLAAGALRSLNAKFKLILSGTPIENNITDLFSLIMIIMPESKSMLQQISNSSRDQAHNIKLTKSLIEGLYLARKMSHKQLPVKLTKIKSVIELSSEERRIYNNIRNYYSSELKSIQNNSDYYRAAIVGLMRLIQAISYSKQLPSELFPNSIIVPSKFSKIDKVQDLINKAISNNEKIVIFSRFTATIDAISNNNNNALVIKGDVSKNDRDIIVNKFQNDDKYKVIIISLQAGATGLTLTAANNLAFVDLWWNPAIMEQAARRIYRIGQTKDCIVTYITAIDTIDDNILNILLNKSKIIDALDGNTNTSNNSTSKVLIDDIFKK